MSYQSAKNPIRIGQIDFVNVWPFFESLSQDQQSTYQFIKGVPTVINRMMENGELDLAPVSSIAFAKNSDDWYLIPDVSISASREVKSIILLHKQPIASWTNVEIALTSSSETSVALLKWLVSTVPNVTPRYKVLKPNGEEMLKQADAALLIGDEALRYLLNPISSVYCTDLGQWWNEQTEHSMTYAVWAVRKESYHQREEEIERFIHRLQQSPTHAFLKIDEGFAYAQQRIGGHAEFWRDYFYRLKYTFSPQERNGLHAFYRACQNIGILTKIPDLISGKDILKMRVDA